MRRKYEQNTDGSYAIYVVFDRSSNAPVIFALMPCDSLLLSMCYRGGRMRRLFVACKSRNTAKKRCPWASITMKVDGGFVCFESMEDYRTFKSQK